MVIFLHHFLAWFLHSPRSVFGKPYRDCPGIGGAYRGIPWRLGAYWWNG